MNNMPTKAQARVLKELRDGRAWVLLGTNDFAALRTTPGTQFALGASVYACLRRGWLVQSNIAHPYKQVLVLTSRGLAALERYEDAEAKP